MSSQENFISFVFPMGNFSWKEKAIPTNALYIMNDSNFKTPSKTKYLRIDLVPECISSCFQKLLLSNAVFTSVEVQVCLVVYHTQ